MQHLVFRDHVSLDRQSDSTRHGVLCIIRVMPNRTRGGQIRRQDETMKSSLNSCTLGVLGKCKGYGSGGEGNEPDVERNRSDDSLPLSTTSPQVMPIQFFLAPLEI